MSYFFVCQLQESKCQFESLTEVSQKSERQLSELKERYKEEVSDFIICSLKNTLYTGGKWNKISPQMFNTRLIKFILVLNLHLHVYKCVFFLSSLPVQEEDSGRKAEEEGGWGRCKVPETGAGKQDKPGMCPLLKIFSIFLFLLLWIILCINAPCSF